ncbi:MAG: hypothetical protein NVS1B12_17490 [Acidimicrobiales bacterium]
MSTRTVQRAGRPACVAVAVAVLVGDILALGSITNRAVPVSLPTIVERYRQRSASSGINAASALPAAETPSAPLAASAAGAGPAPPAQPSAPTPASAVVTALTAHRPGARDAAPIAGPPPGVYVYATSGHEDVSVAGGARHDYPAQTTITVTATPCGRDLRWDALAQRWDVLATCMSGSQVDLATYTTHHEFFSVRDERTYSCPPGTAIRPATTTPGASGHGQCSTAGATSTVESSVRGVDNIVVGTVAVPALHVHIVQILTGQTSGTRTTDAWFALSNDLLVRSDTTVNGRSKTPIGESNYFEVANLTLTSLTPQR